MSSSCSCCSATKVIQLDGGGGGTLIDNGDGTYTFIDSGGNQTTFTGGQGLSTLVDNGDGTLTYTDEEGNITVFSAGGGTLVDNGDGTYTFTDGIGNQTTFEGAKPSSPLVDNGDGTYSYTDEDGNTVTFSAGGATLVDNGDGTYTYTDNQGNATTFQGGRPVSTLVDNGDGTYTYVDEDGNVVTFTSGGSTLVDNGDGTYTFTDNQGNATTFDGGRPVSTLVNNGDGTYTYTDEEGNTVTFDGGKPTSTMVDNGDGTYTYTDEEGNVTILESSVTEVIGGPGISVVETAGPNGEKIYTATFDPTTLTTQQLDDLCAALTANGCLDAGPVMVSLAKTSVAVPGATGSGTFTPTGVGNRTTVASDVNDAFASPNPTLSATPFGLPFTNPVAAPNFQDQLWDLNLPSGVTEFSFTATETGTGAAGGGIFIFDSSTNTMLPLLIQDQVGDGASYARLAVGSSATRTYTVPIGVDSANLQMVVAGMGSGFGTATDGVAFSNESYTTVAADTGIDYTFTVTNNGTSPAAGLTIDDPAIGVSGLALTPDPIPAGGTATATASYSVSPGDIAAGTVPNQAEVTGTGVTDLVFTTVSPGGTFAGQCLQLDWRSRVYGQGTQSWASLFDAPTQSEPLSTGDFAAPGWLTNLAVTGGPGPFDTFVNLDLPAGSTGFSFDISITSNSNSDIWYGFFDLDTGLRIEMDAVVLSGTSGTINVNALNTGGMLSPGGSGTVDVTLPAGVDPASVGLVVMESGNPGAGASHDIVSIDNIQCASPAPAGPNPVILASRTALTAFGDPQGWLALFDDAVQSEPLDIAGFVAPGYLSDAGSGYFPSLDTIIDLNLPPGSTDFTFFIHDQEQPGGSIWYGFYDKTTGLRIEMDSQTVNNLVLNGAIGSVTPNGTLAGGQVFNAQADISVAIPAGVAAENVSVMLYAIGTGDNVTFGPVTVP